MSTGDLSPRQIERRARMVVLGSGKCGWKAVSLFVVCRNSVRILTQKVALSPSPEGCSPDTANGYASENDAFSFCLASIFLRKRVQCCLENLCVRTIEQATALYWPLERF
jgi:hypothetical protein